MLVIVSSYLNYHQSNKVKVNKSCIFTHPLSATVLIVFRSRYSQSVHVASSSANIARIATIVIVSVDATPEPFRNPQSELHTISITGLTH